MKKENLFDLFEAQQKDAPAPADRVPGEVKPEDVEPAQEASPAPEPKQEPAQEAQEGGKENGA